MAKKKAAKKKAAKKAKPARQSARSERPRSPRRQALPGMEDVFIKEVDDAARDYVDIKDERVALTAKEVPAKQKLIDAMHKHEIKVYRHSDLEVVLTVEKEKVKVRLKDDNAGADDDEPDGDDGDGEKLDAFPQ